jgi:hypothetical protein
VAATAPNKDFIISAGPDTRGFPNTKTHCVVFGSLQKAAKSFFGGRGARPASATLRSNGRSRADDKQQLTRHYRHCCRGRHSRACWCRSLNVRRQSRVGSISGLRLPRRCQRQQHSADKCGQSRVMDCLSHIGLSSGEPQPFIDRKQTHGAFPRSARRRTDGLNFSRVELSARFVDQPRRR